MKKLLSLVLLLFVQVSAAFSQQALHELVNAEKAFAHLADSISIKSAFLAYLADSGMIFTPAPSLGKPVYQNMPEGPGKLYWYPTYAVLSAGEDMGITTGPFTFKPNLQDSSSWRHGHFCSVWQKEADGSWKNVADFGINHAAPEQAFSYPESRALTATAMAGRGTKASLVAADKAITPGYMPYSASSALYRDGQPPMYSNATALATKEALHFDQWKPLHMAVASAGDFGYSYGYYSTSSGPKGYYMRVWQHQPEGWKVLLEVMNRAKP